MRSFLFWMACCFAIPAYADQSISRLSPQERGIRQARDLEAVARYRHGLEEALKYMRSKPEIYSADGGSQKRMLSIEEREAVRRTWQRVLDYYLALDATRRFHGNFAALDDGEERKRSFKVSYAAFLAGYSNALELIGVFKKNPHIDFLLNEAVPELGLPAATYDRFKFRFLNVVRASEFAALEVVRKSFSLRESLADDAMEKDIHTILTNGKGKGQVMTVANGLQIIQKTAHTAWFPAQAGVAEWMGDTKVYRPKRSLVSSEQIAALPKQLEPGDVLLVRREWYLSNIGLPGFWPHAAIYIGTAPERAAYFNDAVVQAWVRNQGVASGELDALLRARYPRALETSALPQEHGHLPRVLEAISEGVSFTAIEHAADGDSVAVLRPRLPKVEKAQALLRAFGYAGRPYDFDFDFRTDAALVCTELVYKSYEPASGMQGLMFPLLEVMGRLATPANEIVKQFDVQYGGKQQQFDFVLFLDGQEKQRGAVNASLEAFRQSWQRPKWHVLVQEAAEQTAGKSAGKM